MPKASAIAGNVTRCPEGTGSINSNAACTTRQAALARKVKTDADLEAALTVSPAADCVGLQ